MAVFPEEAGRANDNVQAVNTGLDSELGIAHVAADVCRGGLVGALGGCPRSVTHVSGSWPVAACQSAILCFSAGRGKREGAHLQAELANGLAVPARLLRRSGRGQLDVVDAERIEGCAAQLVSVVGGAFDWDGSGVIPLALFTPLVGACQQRGHGH